MKVLRKIINKLTWYMDEFFWIVLRLNSSKFSQTDVSNVTIGITTFMDRYKSCFKPLLWKVTKLFPDANIIVIANGHVRQDSQLNYLNEIESYCKEYKNVELIKYIEPKGLSYIWNRIIERSITKRVLMLNDDIKIKVAFRKFLVNSGILEEKIAVINKSWSNFIIHQELFNIIGPFDEGLKEIGGEDDDYAARITLLNHKISYYKTKTIGGKLKEKKRKLTTNSYGKNMKKEAFGYSTFNTEYMKGKWISSDQKFEGSVEVENRSPRYWKLKKTT